jgi:hypothetical protein
MRPPRLNIDTLELLYEWVPDALPEKERWLDCEPGEANDRYVVIGDDGDDRRPIYGFGGCWPELRDAVRFYDWNVGPPAYVVDLFAAPDEALHTVLLIPTIRDRPGSLRTHVG